LVTAAAKADHIVTENAKPYREAYKITNIVTARQLLAIVEPGVGLILNLGVK
jgi:hypothetical protein